jgi:hypothetical protein
MASLWPSFSCTASAKVVSNAAKEFEDNVAAAINYSPT